MDIGNRIQLHSQSIGDAVLLGGRYPPDDALDQVHGRPGHPHNDHHLPQKVRIDLAGVDVIVQKHQTEPVHQHSQQLRPDDPLIELVNGGGDVEDLRYDQRSEGNRNDPHEGLLEQHQTQDHNDHALVDADPQPHEECADVEVPGFT